MQYNVYSPFLRAYICLIAYLWETQIALYVNWQFLLALLAAVQLVLL